MILSGPYLTLKQPYYYSIIIVSQVNKIESERFSETNNIVIEDKKINFSFS